MVYRVKVNFMINTKNNQTTKVLLFGNKAYTCLLENGEVKGFTKMPYLDVKGDFVLLNLNRLNNDIQRLNHIDIVGSVRKTTNADAFRDNIVKPLIEIQNFQFNISNLSKYINGQNFSDSVVEKINGFEKLASSYVRLNDDFVSQYCNNIPKAWAEEMFHGADYNQNPSCVRENQIAKGVVSCDIQTIMTTRDNIKTMDSIPKMRALGTMHGLNEQIVKANRKNSSVKY